MPSKATRRKLLLITIAGLNDSGNVSTTGIGVLNLCNIQRRSEFFKYYTCKSSIIRVQRLRLKTFQFAAEMKVKTQLEIAAIE